VAASLTILTPLGALVGLAIVVPVAALVVAERRVRRARRLIGLAPPAAARVGGAALAVAAVPVLLALAAAQPALRSTHTERVRLDAQALFVLDTSRSMAAASRPGAKTRLARAESAAVRLRAAIPAVPSGVATLTDRLLPDLLPTADAATFASTVERAVGIEQPPPQQASVVATTLGALRAAASSGYFSPGTRRRLLVVLTDGESRPFSVGALAAALRRGPGTRLVLVHVWRDDEHVYSNGRPEAAYRPDPESRRLLDSLADATSGSAFGEGELGAASGALQRAAGKGPVGPALPAPHTTPLAPYVAAVALLPLAIAVGRRGPLPLPGRRF
jgi:hypothetical protein